MSAVEPREAPGPGSRAGLGFGLKAALGLGLAMGVAAVLYVIGAALIKPDKPGGLQGAAKGAMAKLQVLDKPVAEAPVRFVDATGRPVLLTDFKGHPVVLNLWATWCAPCVKEMPTLAALQGQVAGQGVKVLAVSMDNAAQSGQAKAFIARHAPLDFYQDAKFAFLTDMIPHPAGFPTTVLIDRKGYERAIYAGDADWSGPDARAAVDKLAGL